MPGYEEDSGWGGGQQNSYSMQIGPFFQILEHGRSLGLSEVVSKTISEAGLELGFVSVHDEQSIGHDGEKSASSIEPQIVFCLLVAANSRSSSSKGNGRHDKFAPVLHSIPKF